ncbi:hypothetical protein H072_7660 [Dactylellina haptotyla CBS 200.50]|uniref:SPRY domain-containing protein n=1 Tax=Dactylellina haptotyla (strain CBS 200.50) TaxID=1284197 RepID=S8ABM5_DACHA|nr:hypothetical protein H072_7660 [Dactylellina haptotyla CBS 200.50]
MLEASTSVGSKALAVPSSYADSERYFISSGKQFHFHKIPTANYRLAQTAESIKTKGTLWQLNPSAADDATTNSTWDVFSNLPLFAARYDSPLISGEDSKTIYWEFEITSAGYEGKPASLAFGFLVKDEGSDAVAAKADGSLRSNNPAAAPISLSGPTLLWNSTDGGVYFNGTKIDTEAYTAQVGDTIGLGITFQFDPSVPMVPTRDVLDNPNAKAGKMSKSIDSKGNKTTRIADVADLVACPTKTFITINGVEKPFDGAVSRDAFKGITDVFPVLMVSGPGVGGKVRIGEAVKFGGDGGQADAQLAAKGNAGKAGHKKSLWGKIFKPAGGGSWTGGVGQGAGF